MITLKKAMKTDGTWTTFPGAGSMMAQRRAQATDAPANEVNEVMSLYTTMPKEQLHVEGHFIDPYDVVKGLGMAYDDEVLWAHRVGSLVTKSAEEVTLRKGLHAALHDDKDMPNDVRGELTRRVLVFYRSKRPPKGLGLQKAFPQQKPPQQQPGKPMPPKPGQGPQPGKRPGAVAAPMPTGKPKMMDMAAPGKAPPSIPDQQAGGQDDPTANPVIDTAGLDEQPQDPQLLKTKLMRLQQQLDSMHGDIASSPGHIHMHNEIRELLRQLYKNPTPDGLREAEHQVAHFSALVGGAPDMDPNADPNNPNAPPGQPGAGGPTFRQPGEKPSGAGGGAGQPPKKGITLNKAFGESGAPSTAISRPKPASPAPAAGGAGGEGSRGGHIVGHTAQGDPIYASHSISPAPPGGMAAENPEQKHMRLKQQMMDAAKALHEHEQAHGIQSSFGSGGGAGGAQQLGGQAPGWTSPTAQTVIRGQQGQPGTAKPAITLNAAHPALASAASTTVSGPPSAAIPPAPQAGTVVSAPQAPAQDTTAGRRNTTPEARGQAKSGSAAPDKSLSGPAEGNIEDSKKIAEAVSQDGYVGKTSTGKEIKVGADTSNMSPAELNEASQLHRAAQQHLLAAANATGNEQYRQAAKKHLNEEFRLTSEFTSHQSGAAGWNGAPMQKALAWKPLAAWGAMPFLRAMPRRLDRRPPLKLVTLEKASKGIKLSEAQQSALEIHVQDPAHDDDEERNYMRPMIQGDHFHPPEDAELRSKVHGHLQDIAESEHDTAHDYGNEAVQREQARSAHRALTALALKVHEHGKVRVPVKRTAQRKAELASAKASKAGAWANGTNKPEDHAEAARAVLEAVNAHHDAGNTETAERVEKTAQQHMASAGAVYIGPRGGRWRDAAHKHHVEKGRARITLVKALGEERSGHKYESRTPKAGGGYDYKYAGPVGHNEHERVFDGTHDDIVPHTQIQQDRPSPDDAVERSAKYMDQAQTGEGKKREPLEVWKVKHPDGTHHFALRDGNTTFQMLRKRGWTQFPVKVTKTLDQKDYTPVGAHISAAEKEHKAQKRKDELSTLKKTVEHLQSMTSTAGLTDEHGQQQGSPALEGGVGHHVKIAREFLDRHKQTLERDVGAIKAMAPEGSKVKGRVKTLPSAIGKVVRKPKYGDASKLQDGTGVRVVVKSIQDVRSVVAKLKQSYKVVDEDNYIDKPNGHGTPGDFGYRSHHLIIETADGLQKEIQIRTEGQDKHADWTHDLYKPRNVQQEAAMKEHGESGRQYARQAGDWLFRKESGENAGPAPQPHPAVEAAFGKLKLDQGESPR